MKLNEYQKEARKTSLMDASPSDNVMEPGFIKNVLGLGGEAGEVQEKFKKIIRDNNGKLNEDSKNELIKELGDVLWYLSSICDKLGVELETVAKTNITKLQSRKSRGKLGGDGDNR